MIVFIKLRLASVCGLAIAVGLQGGPASAQDAGGLKAAPADFPAVTYACLGFQLPADEAAAKAAVEAAQAAWVAAAVSGGLARSTPLFVDAELSKPTNAAAPPATAPARVCAIVPAGSVVPSLEVSAVPARTGMAGFCVGVKVDACLEQAAAEAGYTAAKPWPRLPVFARWPAGQAAPADLAAVTVALTTNMIDAASAGAGTGSTVERNTGGLAPLAPCPPGGCPAPPKSEDVPAAGAGVGWFLPLAVKPPPPGPASAG